MHTIMGSNNALGRLLSKKLYEKYKCRIRHLSGSPVIYNPTDCIFPCNALDYEMLKRGLMGSTHVYLLIGLPYRTSIWKQQWPILMANTLRACKEVGAKLIFLDNMYAYSDESINHMTEDSPLKPSSKKGKVRLKLIEMVWEAVERGDLEAIIVRAADFLGGKSSILEKTVLSKLTQSNKAEWFYSIDKLHSFTYIKDAAKAISILAMDPEAYNQTWHLPTDSKPILMRDWVALFASEYKIDPKIKVYSAFEISLLKHAVPELAEIQDISAQFKTDYYFDSSKITKAYGIKATPIEEAIQEIVHQKKTALYY